MGEGMKRAFAATKATREGSGTARQARMKEPLAPNEPNSSPDLAGEMLQNAALVRSSVGYATLALYVREAAKSALSIAEENGRLREAADEAVAGEMRALTNEVFAKVRAEKAEAEAAALRGALERIKTVSDPLKSGPSATKLGEVRVILRSALNSKGAGE